MSDPEVVLEVRDVAKYYPVRRGIVLRRQIGEVKAVDGVSLSLRRGKTLGLVGESGSGKSTLAKVLVGIEKPTRGQILVEGRDVSEMNRADRKRLRSTIQMVFQDPYTSLNPRMSVGEIVGEAYAIHPEAVPEGGKDKAVRALLDRVGLNPDHVHRYPHQFSGGQRQRIGIARALAVKPKILLCDEPVSALDVSIQGQVINLLEELQDELGLSYLFIAHDLSVVRHIADEVSVMYLGRVVESGTDADVYERASHPYTKALMSAVPVPDPSQRDAHREIVLEGDIPSPMDPPSGCHFHTRCWLAPLLVGHSDVERTDGGRPDAETIPAVCRHDAPKLAPQESPDHLAACHFAADAARR